MAKVKPSTLRSLSFNVLPRKVSQKGKKTKVQLAAVLQPQFGLNGAEIVAIIKGRKQRFRYSRQLERFIRDLKPNKENFRPLEKYLAKQIRKGEKNIALPLTQINENIVNGTAESFTVTYNP